MGADRAVHVKCGSEDIAELGPLAVSTLIAKLVENEQADLVILGKQVRVSCLILLYLMINTYSQLMMILTRLAKW